MNFRRDHRQPTAAAKAGFSERTGRRIETRHQLPPRQTADLRPRRQTADPFFGLWDGEIRPMLEANLGLRPITLLGEMQRRHPDHDWDRLRRSLERRVRAWCAEHGADREVIFRQDHIPGRHFVLDRPAAVCRTRGYILDWIKLRRIVGQWQHRRSAPGRLRQIYGNFCERTFSATAYGKATAPSLTHAATPGTR